jgi:hypothetical protein
MIIPYQSSWQERVLTLAKQMHKESEAHRAQNFYEVKVLKLFDLSLTKPDRIYFRLFVNGETLIGGFYGILVEPYFSDVLVAKDLAWFITSNKRGSLAAARLVKDFEVWSQNLGVTQIGLGQSTGVAVEQTQKLYERLGYKVVGVNTIKEL